MSEGMNSDWDMRLNGGAKGSLLGKSRQELCLLETGKTNFLGPFHEDSEFQNGDQNLQILLLIYYTNLENGD